MKIVAIFLLSVALFSAADSAPSPDSGKTGQVVAPGPVRDDPIPDHTQDASKLASTPVEKAEDTTSLHPADRNATVIPPTVTGAAPITQMPAAVTAPADKPIQSTSAAPATLPPVVNPAAHDDTPKSSPSPPTSNSTTSNTTTPTTQAPKTAPASTTEAPKTTPASTTEAPKTTPASTTEAPKTTPASTTQAPKTTPASTTQAPKTTPASTTQAPKTTPAPTTTVKPVPTTAAPKPAERHFDGPSFIGGAVLVLGLGAISGVLYMFYKARTDQNYRTL